MAPLLPLCWELHVVWQIGNAQPLLLSAAVTSALSSIYKISGNTQMSNFYWLH